MRRGRPPRPRGRAGGCCRPGRASAADAGIEILTLDVRGDNDERDRAVRGGGLRPLRACCPGSSRSGTRWDKVFMMPAAAGGADAADVAAPAATHGPPGRLGGAAAGPTAGCCSDGAPASRTATGCGGCPVATSRTTSRWPRPPPASCSRRSGSSSTPSDLAPIGVTRYVDGADARDRLLLPRRALAGRAGAGQRVLRGRRGSTRQTCRTTRCPGCAAHAAAATCSTATGSTTSPSRVCGCRGRQRWCRVPARPRGPGRAAAAARRCDRSAAAAAGLPGQRPARAGAGVPLGGGGVQRPARVVQVRPAERAQVGPPGEQDRVHVVVGRDGAHRDRGDLRAVADGVRERCLVRAAERRALVRADLPGGHVHRVGAGVRERPGDQHRVVHLDAAVHPVGRRDPHGHRPARPARPRGPPRTPPAGSAAGRPGRRRTRSVRWLVSGEMKLDSR